MSDLYTTRPGRIVLYGVSWCGDCRRARSVFTEQQIPYIDIDIDEDPRAAEFVIQVNQGNRSVPTIIFPDGSFLTEPGRTALTEKLQNIK